MASIREMGSTGETIKNAINEKVREAQEMRAEIDRFKAGMEGMPGDLDAEIQSAIAQAIESGKSKATGEITGVESQAGAKQQEGVQLGSQIDAKNAQTGSAVSKMEALRSNKYSDGISSAVSAGRDNIKQGEDIKKKLEDALQKAMSDINTAKSGI